MRIADSDMVVILIRQRKKAGGPSDLTYAGPIRKLGSHVETIGT